MRLLNDGAHLNFKRLSKGLSQANIASESLAALIQCKYDMNINGLYLNVTFFSDNPPNWIPQFGRKHFSQDENLSPLTVSQ